MIFNSSLYLSYISRHLVAAVVLFGAVEVTDGGLRTSSPRLLDGMNPWLTLEDRSSDHSPLRFHSLYCFAFLYHVVSTRLGAVICFGIRLVTASLRREGDVQLDCLCVVIVIILINLAVFLHLAFLVPSIFHFTFTLSILLLGSNHMSTRMTKVYYRDKDHENDSGKNPFQAWNFVRIHDC